MMTINHEMVDDMLTIAVGVVVIAALLNMLLKDCITC
jgi:hypothetical protein